MQIIAKKVLYTWYMLQDNFLSLSQTYQCCEDKIRKNYSEKVPIFTE